ncbi:Cdc25 phosphatase Ibp1 [Paramarasmius palmivorus]|uniref:Cdc25 phosphatase Ibp1 n=1 Tax=Paramarasmius palmivorus TaxID=297713 RepID=A0AAW0BMV2_9AGAR
MNIFGVLRYQSTRTLSSLSRPQIPRLRMIKYITGDELANIIKSDKVAKKDYLVVDVRDDDFEGGNIKGALNKPSRDFLMHVDELVKDTKDVPLVVFHCTLSQVRGPKAARVCRQGIVFKNVRHRLILCTKQIYQETRQNVLDEGAESPTEVMVLRDGFSQFQVKYKDDPALIENWDKDVWASEWH